MLMSPDAAAPMLEAPRTMETAGLQVTRRRHDAKGWLRLLIGQPVGGGVGEVVTRNARSAL